jgi:hypothetical protein
LTDFFEDVEETLRSDRYTTLIKRGWPWALGVALALLLAALAYWGYDTYRKREAAKASEAFASALDSLQKADLNQGYAKFGDAAKSSSKGYRTLALMGQAGIRLDQGETQEAVRLFDEAAKAAPSPILGDLARLKSALALMDTASYAAIEERLKPLTDNKRPYHAAAREALAMSQLRAGRLKEARSEFQVLQLMPDATDASRQRAQVAVLAIDSGAAADLNKVIAAAKALPPTPAPTEIPPQAGAAQ